VVSFVSMIPDHSISSVDLHPKFKAKPLRMELMGMVASRIMAEQSFFLHFSEEY
jgi:hypothetical protein